MKKNINLFIGVISGVLFLLIYNLSAFANQCENIRNDTIRLHIIASSDSTEDQEIKLVIRNRLLSEASNIFDGNVTPDNAEKILIPKLNEIRNITDKILEEYGYEYKSEVTLETEYFDTRIYDESITMPAGKYLALKIILGKGEGQNWWCVMFPALCLPVAEENNKFQINTVYSESENMILKSFKKYEIRFKILEYIESMKYMVDNNIIGDNA